MFNKKPKNLPPNLRLVTGGKEVKDLAFIRSEQAFENFGIPKNVGYPEVHINIDDVPTQIIPIDDYQEGQSANG